MTNKALKFHANIQRSLSEMWTHIDNQMQTLPEDQHLDFETLSDKHKATIHNIKAIEAEWITDPRIRRQLTVLQEDDDQP